MNGNNGLEALAALCGGEAAAVNSNNHGGHHQHQQTNSHSTKDSGGDTQGSSNNTHQFGGASGRSGGVPEGFTSQQWQQAVAAAAALGSNGNSNSTTTGQSSNTLSAQNLALLQAAGISPQAAPAASSNLDSNSIMQQLAYYRYMQEVANLRDGGQSTTPSVNHLLQQNPQALQALFGQQFQQLKGSNQSNDSSMRQQQSQVLPQAAAPSPATTIKKETASKNSMPPPPCGSSLPSTLSTAGISNHSGSPHHAAIAPLPGSANDAAFSMRSEHNGVVHEDKKLQKRAANRKSAQLSRKRKKQFIEELKEENDELRRKEQILRSIPDLIVVFDSAGRLCFVSQSVSRFLSFSSRSLEGTSFWDRLCEDSVRLLKAAFMDSLAARTDNSDTAPLGSGIWELRLVDKDGSHKYVTLNGVVHFSGDRPECVCSIRPRDDLAEEQPMEKKQKTSEEATKSSDAAAVSVSTGTGSAETPNSPAANSSSIAATFQSLIRAKPQQSVISNGNSSSGSGSGSSSGSAARAKANAVNGNRKRREAARISDGDSVSADSGSSDDLGE